ncbi:MAG: hypothetical protein ACTSYJ_02570 [Candidatus Thorarchaeota archaeon]
MSKSHRAFALIFLMIFIVSATIPIAFNSQPVTTVSLVEAPHATSATNYVVDVRVFNELLAFNDDDFEFTVLNGSTPLDNAWVRLFNASTMILLEDDFTDGNGEVIFYNLAPGTYKWNVSHTSDPITPDEIGEIVSDGPEAYVSTLFGNIDWDNDEDDLNSTIIDIEAQLANNLNFSIHFSVNDSIWAQLEVIDGRADFEDIPDGDYIWKLSVLDDPTYAGYLLDSGTLEANSTQKLVHQSIGPLTGNPDYYDIELFTYFETSFEPIIGALVNVTYKNGSAYAIQTTPANGTVLFNDLPAEYMNWTVTHGGLPVGLGDYYFNFSSASSDIRTPIITGPGDQNILLDAENVTITWHLEDEFPATIELFVDGNLNISIAWVNTTYDYIFNVSAAFNEFIIGEYEIKLVVYDQNLNFAENITILTIYEDVFPVIEGPEDAELYFTETGYSLSWNVTDDYLNKYTVMDNDEVFISGDINPDEPIIGISLDGLEIGVHNFTLFANDTSGNTANDTVVVTVMSDDIVPVMVYSPDDIYYSQGDININRNWTASDDYMNYYTIDIATIIGDTITTEEVVNAEWETENIEFDFAGLLSGTYDVTLTVYDLGGNSVQSTVRVVVTQAHLVTYLTWIAIGSVAIIALIAIIWFVRFR